MKTLRLTQRRFEFLKASSQNNSSTGLASCESALWAAHSPSRRYPLCFFENFLWPVQATCVAHGSATRRCSRPVPVLASVRPAGAQSQFLCRPQRHELRARVWRHSSGLLHRPRHADQWCAVMWKKYWSMVLDVGKAEANSSGSVI